MHHTWRYVKNLNFIPKFRDSDYEFRIGVFDLLGDFTDGVDGIGGGEDGGNGGDGEEANRVENSVVGENENNIVLGDSEVLKAM